MSCSKDKEVEFFDAHTYDEVFVYDNFFGGSAGVSLARSIGDSSSGC
jgi:hypothetical protein